jgi:hypothetical protein
MKKLILIVFLIFTVLSCSSKDNVCSSDNLLCEFFEIYYPVDSNISLNDAQLSEIDLDTYKKISNDYLNDSNSESIFHLYSNGIFIPRFSYSIFNEFEEEELWLGVSLYPVDKKNPFLETLNIFYTNNDIKFASESIYGICNLDNNSYLDTISTKIFNCNKENISSYDYWIEQENYMWRIKCVWENDKFYIKNTKTGIYEEINSSDTCRKSFESFKSKIN